MKATAEIKVTIEDVDLETLKLVCRYANLWMQEANLLPLPENGRALEFLFNVHELTKCSMCDGKGISQK